MKNKNFQEAVQSSNTDFTCFNRVKFCVLEARSFTYFVLQTTAKIFILRIGSKIFQLNNFHLNPGPNFFFDLGPDIVYRKIVAALFRYLIRFKLQLKLGHCCLILGPMKNQ